MPYKDPEKARAYRRKWKKSAEQRKKAADRSRQRYAEDPDFRERNKAAAEKYQAANPLTPEEVKAHNAKYERSRRSSGLQKKYGITLEDYEQMLEEQNGCCAICGVDNPQCAGHVNLSVDHCHETGKVRGLLCGPCNSTLGRFEPDLEVLKKVLEYLVNTTT